ncbi:MAG: GAF domain-containing protein, partial [Oscillochloris sp.]|nr:GAF domain-containing protein [Oscillochloris sp.]
MNALFSSEPGETTTLRTWRERSLHFLLRLSLAFLLFPLLVDIIGSFQRGEIAHIYLDVGYYASFILLTFFQRIPFRLRVASLLGLGLSFHTSILMSTGLVSVGRLGILTDVVLAALLLGRVSAIFVWILGLLATGLGLMLFQLQPPDTIVQFTSRLRDPNTLFTQGLFTMSLSGILGCIVLWLFNRINERLRATEQALAERTAQLREALEDLHAAEVKYTTLFQVMPAGITIIDNHGHIREYNNTVQQISQYSYLTSEHIQALAQSFIRPDGTPLPPEEYPVMRVLQEHRTIADIEIGIVEPGADTTWISVTAAPIDLTGYGAVIVCNDITARKNAEQTLKRQLQIQAAIARSSQILLGPAPTAADQQQLLIAALETLYETNSINPIYLSHNIDDPQLGLCACTVSHIGHTYAVEPHPLIQQAPWSVLPNEIYHALATGNLWTGLLPSVLPQQPGLQQIVETYEVQSVLCFPITVDAKWWGTISFTDPRPDRIWSDHEILILRTTAKMIGTAIQRWQTETSLSQQLRYAEALARCSQLLLQPGGDASIRQPLVEAVLHTLREATTASHILVYKHNVSQMPKEPFNILGSVHTADIAPLIIPTTEQLSDIPTEVLEKFKLGQSFSGPVVGRFPDNPYFQQTFDQNGILSMLMIPIALDGRHWGMIEASDCLQARTWDAPSIQLLRT